VQIPQISPGVVHCIDAVIELLVADPYRVGVAPGAQDGVVYEVLLIAEGRKFGVCRRERFRMPSFSSYS